MCQHSVMAFPRYRTIPMDLRAPRDWRRFALWAVIAALAVGSLTVILAISPEMRLAARDIGTVASGSTNGVPLYTGWLVFLGVVFWFGAASLGIVTGRVARRSSGTAQTASMMFWFGLLMLLLGVDDLFRLHDGIFLKLGIKENTTLLVWGVLAMVWGLWHLPRILRDRYMPIFALGVLSFALSILVEQLEDTSLNLGVNEEAAKFGGVLLFAVWAWSVATRALAPGPAEQHPDD